MDSIKIEELLSFMDRLDKQITLKNPKHLD